MHLRQPSLSPRLIILLAAGLVQVGGASGMGGGACYADNYYVGNGANSIYKYNSAGVYSKFISGGINTIPGTGFGNTSGMAFDPSGNLFVIGTDSNVHPHIYRITPEGVGSVFATTALFQPSGLALDRSGNLFVANGNNTILKFNSAGVPSVFANTNLNIPIDLAFDSNDNLFVGNHGNNTITKFTPQGVGSIFASTGLDAPRGLAFDRAGNLFVANYGFSSMGNIRKFTPAGVGSTFYGGGIGIQHPMGLAFGSTGDLFVVSQNNNRIQRLTPAGVRSDFAVGSVLSQPTYLALTDDAGVPLPLANQVPAPGAALLLGLAGAMGASRRRRPA